MPKTYRVRITRKAQKQFKKLHPQAQDRIAPAMQALSKNPRPHGVKKLKGEENLWRIRVGNYRVIYEIRNDQLIVLIVRVAHRSKAY